MKFHNAKQAWAEVHEGFYLVPGWGGVGVGPGVADRSYHCPFCRLAGFMRALALPVRSNGGRLMHWRCVSCCELAERPLLLKRRGAITATETRGERSGAGDFAIVDGLEAGRVLSVIERLPEDCYMWGMWVYTGLSLADLDARQLEVYQARQLAMLEWLIKALDSAGLPDVASEAEADLEHVLLLSILGDTRHRERCGRHLFTQAAIAEKLGIDRRYLGPRYKWGKRYHTAVRALENLTAATLGPVSAVIAELRDGRLVA